MNSSYSGKTFADLAAILAGRFLTRYEQGAAFGAIGMPRRLQLSSLMMQALFQDTDFSVALFTAFLKDPVIRELFGLKNDEIDHLSKDELFSRQVFIVDNSGFGGSQQPLSIVPCIVLSAVDAVVLEKGKLDRDLIVADIPKKIEEFRLFARGEEIKEEHLIGFSGFDVDGDLSIGFGDINAISLNDTQSKYFFGSERRIGLAIRETFCRTKLYSGSQDGMIRFFRENTDKAFDGSFNLKMVELIRNVRLALILALSQPGRPFYSFVEGDFLMSPTGNMNSFVWRDVGAAYKSTPTKLTQNFANKISIKYLMLVDKDLSSISVATSRLLSAVCSRDSLDDALIDAVMCWEISLAQKARSPLEFVLRLRRFFQDMALMLVRLSVN